jgi:hypothetical protein
MRVECNTCLGRYNPVGADGIRYFHVCPPVAGVQVVRDGARLAVPIAELLADDIVVVIRGDKPGTTTHAKRRLTDVLLERVDLPRPNARNENVMSETAGPAGLIAYGLGVRDVTADAERAPAFPPLED